MLLVVLLAHSAPAADWETFTSFREVRRARQVEDTVFMVTSGGLLGITDGNAAGVTMTNIDGLGTTDLTDLIVDAAGNRWLTGAGRLVKVGADGVEMFPTGPVYGKLRLYTVEDDGNQLWLGSDSGLILFSKVNDDGQYENRYRITTINAFPPVYDIELAGDSIWLATGAGLAVADRTDLIGLVSPLNWTVYGTAAFPQLGENRVTRLSYFENTLYVGGTEGFYRLDLSGAMPDLITIGVAGSNEVTDLTINNDTLFVYTTGTPAFVYNATAGTLSTTGLPSSPNTGVRTDGVRWMALAAGGIYSDGSGSFAEYPFIGLPENNLADVTVDNNGAVYALLDTRSAAQRNGKQWTPIPFDVGGRTTKALTDPRNGVWFGTFGLGAYRLADGSLTQYAGANTTLRPAFGTFVVLSGIAVGPTHIFLSVTDPIDGYSVAFAPLTSLDTESAWDSIGVIDGLNDTKVIGLAYNDGELAAATDANGVFLCRPFTNQPCVRYSRANNFLLSDVTRVVQYAPDGALWVGTNFGVSRFDIESGLPRFANVDLPVGFGPDIRALEIDSRGNAWIGANNGLARRDAATGDVEVFTTDNSGLVGDVITGMAIDPVTGDLYVATTSGLSRTPSRFGPPTDDVEAILAFPNPYVITGAGEQLNFNFGRVGSVRIFTVAGELVAERDVNAGWNGTNDTGTPVASGVYIFVVTDENGLSGRGKFLLVRQ
jgi:hypothetical protein